MKQILILALLFLWGTSEGIAETRTKQVQIQYYEPQPSKNPSEWFFQDRSKISAKGSSLFIDGQSKPMHTFFATHAFADVTLSAKYRVKDTKGVKAVGFIWGATDPETYTCVHYDFASAILFESTPKKHQIELTRVGNKTQEPNTWYQAKIERRGNTISVFFNGKKLYQAKCSPVIGRVGFYASQTIAEIKDIKIEGTVYEPNQSWIMSSLSSPDFIHGVPKKQKRAEILWTKAICKEKDRYIGWPTVCMRKNGELLAVFSGDRDAHVCPFGKVQMIRSEDQGETWSKPAIIRNSIVDDRDAGIMELQNGVLVLTWFSSICYIGNFHVDHKFAAKGSKTYYYQRHFENHSTEDIIRNIGYFTMRSTDGGKTWEDPVRTYGSANHGGIQLRDGRLLLIGRRYRQSGNFHPKDPIYATVTHELTLEESIDNAKSWRKIGNFYPEDKTDITLFHEPHLVETGSGKLLAQFRCHLKNHPLYQSESLDGGKTWTPMKQLPIHGLPPHLIRLSDNKLLTVYGRRFGLCGEYGCISDDEGETWDIENEVKIAGHFNGDLGYPSSVQLKDGSIITIYYQAENQGELPALMATKWRITQ